LVGRYLVRQKIAEGGMAEIYLARATGEAGFSKDVVIKMVHSFLGNDPQFVEMFIAEANLASRLSHANVVQIFDFGKFEERYFLAMEYVRGVSLARLRARCQELGVVVPPVLAAEICVQVARGLHYAHTISEGGDSLGVVHRDVTPHNVLLSFDGAVKLGDFGIAKATTSHTAPGMLKGKFAYMSPEQSRGEPVDARTDVFALGIVLWEMLTGGRLFSGDSDVSVLRAVQGSAITPPSRLNPEVPQELSDVVMKALARSVEERFQSAFEFQRALATFVLGNSKTLEDTSVSDFLHRLFPGEFEHLALMQPLLSRRFPDGYGASGSFDAQEPSVTVTPSRLVSARASPGPGELPRVGGTDKQPGLASSGRRTSRAPLEEDASEPEVSSRRTTDPVPVPGRVSSGPKPRPGASSARFARLPPSEPSVVVEPELGTEARAPEEQDDEQERLALEEDLLAARPGKPLLPYVVAGLVVLVVAAGGITALMWPAGAGSPPGAPSDALADESAVEIPASPPDMTPRAAERPTATEKAAVAEGSVVEAQVPAKRSPEAERQQAGEGSPAAEGSPTSDGLAKPSTVAIAPPPAVVAPGPQPTAAPNQAAPKPVEPAVAPVVRMGYLRVKVIPFAHVRANGRELGEAFGGATYQLKAGTYDIELEHPRKQARKTVTIRPDQTVLVELNALE